MKTIPTEAVVWKNVPILAEDWKDSNTSYLYNFMLPEPLSNWDVWDYWEKPRFESMRDNLKQGDILFDIGTEQGWTNLLYADFVGPENIVLIEPTREFWGNIRQTWEKNYKEQPKATLCALISNKTTDGYKVPKDEVWCEESNVPYIIDKNKYQYIHSNDENIPEITIDEYVEQTGIIPDAITMDVEGAEYLIIKGAEQTIKKYKPKLWISIHPDLGIRDYGVDKNFMIDYVSNLGYKQIYIAEDHELHYYFEAE